MIAESAVRMALANHIIVTALRDRADFDEEALEAFAAARMREVADQELGYAERISDRRAHPPIDPFGEWDDEPSDTERDLPRSERREALHRSLAVRLVDLAESQDALIALVDAARTAAWEEIQTSIAARARRMAVLDQEPDAAYATERADRLAALVAVDLTGLAVERGIDPGSL